MTLGPAKHEKVARIGRISNVFRIVGAQRAEQSVGIIGTSNSYNTTTTFLEEIRDEKEIFGNVYGSRNVICHVANDKYTCTDNGSAGCSQ